VAEQERRSRLAREALAAAKAEARARGGRPAPGAVQKVVRGAPADSPLPARAGRRVRRDDPERLRAALDGLVEERGWRMAALAGSLQARWAEIVGPELAAHSMPGELADGELVVTADSTAWATQLRLLAPVLVRRLNSELGDGTVRRVKIRGPVPPGRRGGWRVRGGRGPRDDYG
jgi:predicted nucleic acid-binding Zn ribbon protein